MYGLLITFRTSVPLEQLATSFTDYAHALRRMPGLVSKAWIRDGDALGGFHVFSDQASAEAYLSSDLAGGLRATDGFDDFEIRGFEVLEELSSLTGLTDRAPLAAR